MKNTRGFAHIFLLVAIVLICVTTIVYFAYTSSKNPTFYGDSTITPVTEKTNTLNWKTFVSVFGYSFQYPSDFDVFEEDLSGEMKNQLADQKSLVVNVRSVEPENKIPNHWNIVTLSYFNCIIPKQSSIFRGTQTMINGAKLTKYSENPKYNYFYTYNDPDTGERLCIYLLLNDQVGSLANQIVSTFEPSVVQQSLKPTDQDWKTVINHGSKIQISFPPDFRSKVENNQTELGNGEITLSFLPEFQGSPCANAPCNQWKDIKLPIGNNKEEIRLIWPNSFGFYTFKHVIDHPYANFSISIFGSFPNENDIETIDSILTTLKFLK